MQQNKMHTISLSVAQWRKLTLEGAIIPVRIQLNGSSMQPLIRRNRDYVTIMPVLRPLKRGDIVLFADRGGRYVVHRVWKMNQTGIQTMGDNCFGPDAPLTRDQIWGLVVRMERGRTGLSLDNAPSRIFGRIWMALLPIRKIYLRLRSLAARAYRKIFRRKHHAG